VVISYLEVDHLKRFIRKMDFKRWKVPSVNYKLPTTGPGYA